ncbi:MAG: hypothetical protein V3S82_10740 [Dehalococcoidia bacterium]
MPIKDMLLSPTPKAEVKSRIPSGSFAMLATIKMSSISSSLPVAGGKVRWTSTDYGVMRFVPDVPQLDAMAQTSSKSYSKSYVYPLTASGKLYSVREGTSVSSVNLSQRDPRTGKVLGGCSFYSTHFAIVGNRVYFISKTTKDLYGKRNGGGHLMTARLPCSGAASKLLKYGAPGNTGTLKGVGGRLLRVVSKGDDRYQIREINPGNGEVASILATVTNKHRKFFAGTDALYWYEEAGSDSVFIIRYPLTGTPKAIVALPHAADDLYNIGIDEEEGKVFIVFRDGKPHFYLYDMASASLEDLPIDSSLFSTYRMGNGQFLMID